MVKEAIAVVIIEVIRVTRGSKEAIETITNIGAVSRSFTFIDYHGSSLKGNWSFKVIGRVGGNDGLACR